MRWLYPDSMDSAKVVLVTNVGQGYGRAAALAFGAAGHDVVCADRDVDQASKTAAEIEELGGTAIPVQADMSAQIDVLSTFNKVYEIFGELDGVVHVVAHASNAPFRNLAENEFTELVEENLRSTYLTMKTSLRMHPDGIWLVIIAPPRSAVEPQMMAVQGALRGLSESFDRRHNPKFRSNVVVPSRSAADPGHDAALANTVLFLGLQGKDGVGGQTIEVALPPPPRITDALLPEVRAALDNTVRQDDLEASHFNGDDDLADDSGEDADEDGLDGQDNSESGDFYTADYPDERPDFEEFMDDWEQSFLFDASREHPR